MSKDREGREGKDLDPTAGAEEVESTESGLSAEDAESTQADVSGDVAADEIEDPETEIADADEIEAELEAAEESDADESDDLVDEDIADEDIAEDDAAAGATGVAAVSNRAALRKAGARTGVTEKKGTATRARDADLEKNGVFSRLNRFIREVVAELRKVIWPSQKQMVTYTIVVITFLIFMVALVSGLDVLFHFGVGKIFG